MTTSRRRVVVTGIGPVTPVGIGVETFWRALTSGVSGVGKLEGFDVSSYPSQIAAQVHDFRPEDHLEGSEIRRMARFAQLAVAAAKLGLVDAGLDLTTCDRDRVGCVMGSGIGGIGAFEEQAHVLAERGPGRISPHLVSMMIPNMASAQIAMRLGITGPSDCTVTACAASGHAIARAVDLIRSGSTDVVIAGGAEAAITPLTLAGFCATRALSTRNDDPAAASRPFDKGRDGFVIGEGATALILEDAQHARDRGARIYAEIAGYGLSSDAYHETAPHPDGAGGASAMLSALVDAGLTPGDIEHINAHGTSTPLGDAAETHAIRSVFGVHADRIAVCSTKSMTGHLIGAAGATEAAATALAIAQGIVPPTINLVEPDVAFDLDYVPAVARTMPVRAALTNSFGFGGHNAAIALVAWDG